MARLADVPLNAYRHDPTEAEKKSRWCRTLPHVINHCTLPAATMPSWPEKRLLTIDGPFSLRINLLGLLV